MYVFWKAGCKEILTLRKCLLTFVQNLGASQVNYWYLID
jgi:hypothetical protein